ncbi:helix-turn-helix domain-containing protein [Streptomyces sp. MST-110588]|uniref:winged helix-turn-helix transcriptional regulator n=1 Tax=Streptomyces sp. MST-110588 TaxID=2833628 RepID=UPI001F5D900E|nr:helix-turn-helix domain-containing protein [Streptomyces sp. MST-110588]UNO40526.1 helix-turn-helix transcriptional regulator [Streptomyces sp. MST-110588]
MRTRKSPYECGLDAAVDVIGGKWKVLLLWALQSGPRRFGELKRDVPAVSEKVLIQQLREMEEDRIVHREVYHQVPPKVEYSLTELGMSLSAALEPLGMWGREHMAELEATYDSRHPRAS